MERAKKRTTRKALKTEREVGLATCTCTSFDYEGKFIKKSFQWAIFQLYRPIQTSDQNQTTTKDWGKLSEGERSKQINHQKKDEAGKGGDAGLNNPGKHPGCLVLKDD